MSGNYQKTPLATSWSRLARQIVATQLQQAGKSLPCSVVSVSGQFVTVKFEVNAAPFTLPNITIPINTSLYDWLPIQPGDQGYTQPADVYLGGVSGQGGGVASLTQRANLTALVFQPVSNKSWTAANQSQRIVQGPDGVLLQNSGSVSASIDLVPSGITISVGGNTVVIDSSGILLTAGTVTVQGDLQVNGNINATGTISP